ncbi:MAG TPA: CoA transferase [Chitinophagales bacterium]|nr:CoA transferase [Chitinophagales bacterium]
MITAQQIIESIPVRFRPEKAAGYNAVFQFDISGDETLQYTVVISNGTCTLQHGLQGTADCIIKTKAKVYVELETGKANPQMALMMGKVKVSNLPAMMQFAKCFRKYTTTDHGPQTTVNINTERTAYKPATGPLVGVKIIDFTRLLPGPLATMFLADMGADVIKVEDPDNPDYIRGFEPQVNGTSMFYLALNRNKRSLAVNYLSAAGKQLMYDLIKTADVFIEQYRPGVMKEMGYGYEELSKINPRLIYVSVTGYGQQSSKAMHAGHDLNYIGIAGALGITGADANHVTIPGFQLADIGGGSYMAMNAVLAALYQRERTGKGEWIDVAMTDAALPFAALQFAAHQGNKQPIARGDFELNGQMPNYNVYRCADGKFVALGSLEPKFWNKFCTRVNRPEWSTGFLKKGEELKQLKQEVAALFATRTRAEWLEYFKEDDFCFTTINDLEELENDAYLNERHMFVENEHPAVGRYKTINQPLKFLQAKFDNNRSAPELGYDTSAILIEMNYNETQIKELKDKSIVKA